MAKIFNVSKKDENLDTVGPMFSWCNRFRELFDSDPDIEVGLEGTNHDPIIKMVVNNEIKALCIQRIVPKEKKFNSGKNTVTIEVVVKPHFGGDDYLKDVVYEAFKGNPLFKFMHWFEDPEHITNPCCWVEMKNDAIFWPESNLNNIYGDSFSLPCDIAKEMIDPQVEHFFFDCMAQGREIPQENTKYFN